MSRGLKVALILGGCAALALVIQFAVFRDSAPDRSKVLNIYVDRSVVFSDKGSTTYELNGLLRAMRRPALVRRTADGKKVVGWMAKSFQVTEGDRKFVFDLIPGLTADDGSPITAERYVRGLAAVIHARMKSGEVGTFEFLPELASLRESPEPPPALSWKENSVVLQFKTPQPDLLVRLQAPRFGMIDQDEAGKPESTTEQRRHYGPWKMAAVKSDRVVFERSRASWPGASKYEQINFIGLAPEEFAKIQDSGDFILQSRYILEIPKSGLAPSKMFEMPDLLTLTLNCETDPWTDAKLRQNFMALVQEGRPDLQSKILAGNFTESIFPREKPQLKVLKGEIPRFSRPLKVALDASLAGGWSRAGAALQDLISKKTGAKAEVSVVRMQPYSQMVQQGFDMILQRRVLPYGLVKGLVQEKFCAKQLQLHPDTGGICEKVAALDDNDASARAEVARLIDTQNCVLPLFTMNVRYVQSESLKNENTTALFDLFWRMPQ